MKSIEKELQELKNNGECAEFVTVESLKTLRCGYLLPGETPRGMWRRSAKASAERLGKPELEDKFFDLMWNNWLCLATPVASNMGTDKGLVISCFSTEIPDSVDGIMDHMHELAVMSKHGGGVGMHWNKVRAKGSVISTNNGVSDGVIPFLKIQDSTTIGINQGSSRRGASVAYLPIDHGDIKEFLNMRKPTGDAGRNCLNLHHGITITDAWMNSMLAGDKEKRELWKEILKLRFETGEPYFFFTDTVNRNNPPMYKEHNLSVKGSNLCLAGNVLVQTKVGHRTAQELAESNTPVDVWDGNQWTNTQFYCTQKEAEVMKITLMDNTEIIATPTHKWFRLVPSGMEDLEFVEETVETKDLAHGMLLVGDRNKTPLSLMVKEVVPYSHKIPVYCCTVPTTHRFLLTCGVMSGNCNEIYLHTDEDHSFVCCLSSMNLARFDEWKNTDAVYLATWFLDGVMQEFIDKAKHIKGFERAVRFAEKGRSVGLGQIGLATYFQKHMIPFDSFDAFQKNAEMFKHMQKETIRASKDLAKEYGEPEWCVGHGVRNTHLQATAPTVSNALISGDVSPSVEPWAANVIVQKSAKGTFIRYNKELKVILAAKEKDTDEVWQSITVNDGSVQHLDFLSPLEKEVFLTAREINQFAIIKLAAQRQKWIDQGQSINLFFPGNVDPKYFHEVHVAAYKEGLKGLYYCRADTVLKQTSSMAEPYRRDISECKACEG